MSNPKQIDKEATLKAIKDRGYSVLGLARRFRWNPVLFYQTLGGQRGKTDRAVESARIIDELDRLDLLVYREQCVHEPHNTAAA
ncbi:hypothetical protein [Desulfobulbus elongatus]|uniref:hypothetical protein n=1 Tax=Desulfobulbus elongatus TaxID=53332 RepID=UPI0004891860|nr:hypothetical protein [Desulfobulbus elongatus]